MFSQVLYGGDYNPEQWPEEVWGEDVALMHAANVNVATTAVFAWVTLQPAEDTYCFEWLDRVIAGLHAGGIRVCLATATASVPAWMDRLYPDVRRTDINGRKMKHGGRHTFCPNSPNFRRLAASLVSRLAERYANHPAVVVWHISNEYGAPCYCDLCAAEFRVWLQERYGSLEAVNHAWNSIFWGHTFTAWDEIETPTLDGDRSMPSLLVDYDRFQSQSLLECCKAERDILRAAGATQPITTNFMGTYKPLDYQKWAQALDVVSWDSYPSAGAPVSDTAFQHSVMRGLKEGKPWMLMEQAPSQSNWGDYSPLKRPGELRTQSFQAVAHGADAVMYFQWRRSRGSFEMFHSAVVDHDGTGDTRVFREVAEIGRELAALGTQTLGARVQSPAAVLFDWDNWWTLEYASFPCRDFKYVPLCRAYFSALYSLGISADVIAPDADLSAYKLLIAPALYAIKPGWAEKLERFVEGGGTLVLTCRSAIVDETGMVLPGGQPGSLRRLAGLRVEEVDILEPHQRNQVRLLALAANETEQDKTETEIVMDCTMLCERLRLESAVTVGVYAHEFYAGEPAITSNSYGTGRTYYVGAALDAAGVQAVLDRCCREQGLVPPLGSRPPAGVEVMVRRKEGEAQIYVLNHTSQAQEVPLPDHYRDLLTEQVVKGTLALPPRGVSILARVRDDA